MRHHLAQLNIARFRYEPDDPRVSGFFEVLDHINALAENSPGFVWRLKDESGNATEIDVFGDHRLIVNLSVWESVEDLKAFAYKGDHLAAFRKRAEWFEPMPEGHLAMWWVEAGSVPSAEQAKQRLEYLRANGPSDKAFTFASLQPAQ